MTNKNCKNSKQIKSSIRHVFGFEIEFLENKDIGIFEYFIVIDISIGIPTILIFHLFQLPDFVDLELGVLSAMVNGAYLYIIPYSQHSETSCFIPGRHTWHISSKRCRTTNIHIELP